MRRNPFTILAFLLLVVSLKSFAQTYRWIDPDRTWFGYEASFQDQQIAEKDGEMTMDTPHKEKALEKLINAYHKETGFIVEDTEVNDGDFKPGVDETYINSDEQVRTTMEPGCIEWNFGPKTIKQIVKSWTPVFKAAEKAKLTNYYYQVGTGSGGGHFHVGGPTPAENPFIKNPLLLRNLFAYFHEHPSLSYAFGEAYDIGEDSNTPDLHLSVRRQLGFQRVIEAFDNWYKAETSPTEKRNAGAKFIQMLESDAETNWVFAHYSMINLEHMSGFEGRQKYNTQKTTVEFRGVRSLPSAKHIEAFAEMLLRLMDHLADPELQLPFKVYTAAESLNMMSLKKTELDWEKVKAEIKVNRPELDELIHEYATENNFKKQRIKNGFIRETYSDPDLQGRLIEIAIAADKNGEVPKFYNFQGVNIRLEEVSFGKEKWAIGVFDKRRSARKYFQGIAPMRCLDLFM